IICLWIVRCKMEERQRSTVKATMSERYSNLVEDEINLLDLWRVLIRRKATFFVVFLLVMASSLTYLVLAKPVYESRAVIQVGITALDSGKGPHENSDNKRSYGAYLQHSYGYLEEPISLIARLKAQYTATELQSVTHNKKGALDIITLTSHAHSPNEAQQKLSGVVDAVLKQHENMFAEIKTKYGQFLNDINDGLEQYQRQQAELSTRVDAILSSNPAMAAVLTQEKASLLSQQTELERQKKQIKIATMKAFFYPSTMLSPPSLPAPPVKPKVKLIVAVSLILGFMLGIFAAFFAELIAKAKAQLKEEAV
ncbi:MAG: hypothetical protein KAJ19_21825, partial [Gammaproteobacteria bacterium]|nr:hypothetical protein [Gammaproteobacteria bacterium]